LVTPFHASSPAEVATDFHQGPRSRPSEFTERVGIFSEALDLESSWDNVVKTLR
jgi:hypothetical protein